MLVLDEYIEKIKGGWTDVDVIITQPAIMGKIGARAVSLGPRGLMPNPKSGTVTADVAKAVEEVKKGKIDFKVDKNGIVHSSIGKVSFTPQAMVENAREFIATPDQAQARHRKGHIYQEHLSFKHYESGCENRPQDRRSLNSLINTDYEKGR